MKNLFIEMLQSERTLVTRVSILIKPTAMQALSERSQFPAIMVYTVRGMLIEATIRSEKNTKSFKSFDKLYSLVFQSFFIIWTKSFEKSTNFRQIVLILSLLPGTIDTICHKHYVSIVIYLISSLDNIK